jgi:hypothetical protein
VPGSRLKCLSTDGPFVSRDMHYHYSSAAICDPSAAICVIGLALASLD